jgi:hypothetical protein
MLLRQAVFPKLGNIFRKVNNKCFEIYILSGGFRIYPVHVFPDIRPTDVKQFDNLTDTYFLTSVLPMSNNSIISLKSASN